MTRPAAARLPLLRRRPFTPPYTPFELLRKASSGTKRRVLLAVLVAWLPAAVLCALQGTAVLKSFLSDFAAQSRFFIVIPILILAFPPLCARLEMVAANFLHEGLVKEEDRARFTSAFDSFNNLGRSLIARVVLLILVYMIVFSLLASAQAGSLPLSWYYGGGGLGILSLAGTWYALVSLPVVGFLLLQWIWRQVLWARFLRTVARLDLKLIAAHPDHAAGLSFVETCLRGYMPFCFAVGTLVAGGVANRVVYLDMPLKAFQFIPFVVIPIVLLICIGPLCFFLGMLLRTRRKGTFEYGALANRLGREFEQRWVRGGDKIDESALAIQDFSATTDLYSIVAQVHEMKPVPVGLRSVTRLVWSTLVPMVLVLFLALPFEVVMERVMRLLL
jgi:hypothetical protein